MKFKVHAHKVEHVADIEVEESTKMEASRKVSNMLDTQNGVYILVIESETPGPVSGCVAWKNLIQKINESENRATGGVQLGNYRG
jgi:hypothetical protein